MTDTQKNNNHLIEYTRIRNEIIEGLCGAGLNGTELSVALFVIRKTYGFNKKSDKIPLSQFVEAIKVSRRSVLNALETLKVVKILTLVQKGSPEGIASEWAFNKNIEQWRVVKKTALVQKRAKGSEDSYQKVVKKTAPSKDNTKDNTKERGIDTFLSSFQFEEFWELYPKGINKGSKIAAFNAWKEVVDDEDDVLDKFKKALVWQTKKECFSRELSKQPSAVKYIQEQRWDNEEPPEEKKSESELINEFNRIGFSAFKTKYGFDLADEIGGMIYK